MRTVNVPLLIALLIGAAILGGGLFFVHQYQVRRNAGVFLEQADEAREELENTSGAISPKERERKLIEVLRQYKAYLQLRPDDIDVRESLGRFMLKQGLFTQAINEIEAVLRQSPGRSELRRELVDVAMDLGQRQQYVQDVTVRARQSSWWFDSARQHLELFLLKDRPNDPELLELTGRCYAFLAKDDQAAEYWRRAIAVDAQQIDAHTRLAALLRYRLNRAREADELMDKLAKDNPDHHMAQLSAATYALDNRQLDEAVKRVDRALELKGDDKNTLLLAARTALAKQQQLLAQRDSAGATKELERARQYSGKLRSLFPDDYEVYRSAAEIEARAGNGAEAANVLREGLKATNDNPTLVFHAINLLLDLGEREEAQAVYDRIVEAPLRPEFKGFLLGRLKLAEGKWRDAIDQFEKSRPALAASAEYVKQLDYLTGRAWTQLGNLDQAMRAYRLALSSDAFYAPAQVALMEAMISSGQIESAVDLYRQFAGRIPAGGLLTAARLLILRNMQLRPDQRDWVAVERVLTDAAKAEPNSWQVPLIQCDVYLAQGRDADAAKILEETRRKMPDRPEVWSASIALAQRSDPQKAEALMAEAKKLLGDTVELRLARARALVQQEGKAAAAELQKMADDTAGLKPNEQLVLWSGLTNLLLQSGDVPAARALCRRVADAQPTNVQIRFLLFELALQAGDSSGLAELLDDIEHAAGRGAMWHYAKAVILTVDATKRDDPKLNEALDHLKKAEELRPSWSRAQLMMARIYDQQGNVADAFAHYRKAVDGGERNVAAIRRLGQLYQQRRDFASAQRVFGMLGEAASAYDKRLISIGLAQQGDFDEALAAARQSAEGSKDFVDHLWKGQLLDASARKAAEANAAEADRLREEAEASLREAANLAPHVPDVWIALVRLYAGAKQTEKAEKAIAQASQQLDPKDRPLALAQCYEVLGKAEEVRRYYLEALAAAPKDPVVVRSVADFYSRIGQLDQAEELARKVLSGEVPGETADQVWARRVIALVLTAWGDGPSLREALKLVDQNLAVDANSVMDLRLKGSLLASMPSRPETKQSIQAFQRVMAMSSTPDDSYILAQLFLKERDWSGFVRQMQSLLASHPNEPRYLALYVAQLLKRGEVVNALPYLERMENLVPNHFGTVHLRADVLVSKKEYEEARQLIKGFIDRPGAQPSDRPTRLRLAAESLEQFSHRIREPGQRAMAQAYVRDAEMLYRLYTEARPENEILIVGFLARLGRIGEAIDVLEPIWQKNKPDPIASVVLEFARSGDATPADLERLEKTVNRAIAEFKMPTSLTLVMAEIYQKENRIAEAEKLYREVLKQEPRNVIALNNLAVLLALEKRQLDEALRLVNQAIDQAGREPQMLDSRASVYIAMRRPTDALSDLDEAISDAADPVRLFHQAQAYNLTGNRRKAAEVLASAIEKGLTAGQLQVAERKAFEELKKVVDLEAAKP